MARAVGLMNPDNASKSAGIFKEGFVRIDFNSYKVHQGKGGDSGESTAPATKWSWMVTRLGEDAETPITDEHDEPVTEELLFSFGGKALAHVHPGHADGPDDPEPEDLGTDVGVEGNTIFLASDKWTPNEKSGLMVLTASMSKQGIPADYFNRCWAPEWNGCIFEMKSQAGEKGNDGRAFSYKVVSKVVVRPGGGKGKIASVNGKGAIDPTALLGPILKSISEELDGQQITHKAFIARVKTAINAKDARALVPVLSLAKDWKWLQDHGDEFDLYVDEATASVHFGELPI